ncbi:MAG: TonB-dependent receptor, partial [Bryobacteraceae bacterium]
MTLKKVFYTCFLAILATSAVFGQQDKGTISGTVLDPSGAAVAAAIVTLRDSGTGATRTAKTGNSGEFVFALLSIGTYEVTVEAAGFDTEVKKSLELQIQQTLDLKFSLRVGSQARTIDVTDVTPPLQTADSSIGQVISTRAITNLPLNGRDVMQLLTLVPGVATGPDGSPAISGQPTQYQYYALDGIDNTNYQGNLQSGHAWNLSPSPDAVQEFKVQTNNYSAEFGQSAGGVVNVILKSGTNDFHGSAYEYLRNTVLDARNFFAATRAPYQQNQFGGSISGPVIIPKVFNGRNKLFFFGDYEGFRSAKGTTENVFLPSAAYRQGNFQNLLTGQTFTDPCTGAVYDTGQLFDPTTTHQVSCQNGSTGFARNPIIYNGQANVLNPSQIVPAAANTIPLLPQPNSGPNNFIWSPSLARNYNRFDIKIDQQWGDKDHLSYRFAMTDTPSYGVPEFPGEAGSGSYTTTLQLGAAFGETHIFTPTTVNEFRVGWTRNSATVSLANTSLNPATLGYGGINYQPGILGGLPSLSFSDVSGFGASAWTPSIYKGQSTQIIDTISLVRGPHTFKIGGAFNNYGWVQYQPQGSAVGAYSFSGILTADLNASGVSGAAANGSGWAQFLFGIPDGNAMGSSIDAKNIRQTGALFIQDDWKVSPKLTVNLGLRWDFGSTLGEQFNRVTNFDPTNGYLQLPTARKNQAPAPPAGLPVEYLNSDTLFRNSLWNFGPRVGFAYQPTSGTVIRSGFGIFYLYPYPPGTASGPLNLPWANSVIASTPPTGPIDPVTHEPVSPVTSIVSGFPAGYLSQVLVPPTLYAFDTKPLYPYSIGWNFAVQQQVGWNTVLEVAYAGSAGNHLLTGIDLNQPTPTADQNSNPQTRRAYPLYGPIALEQTAGHSSYNALEVKVEKRFSNGLSFLSSFTWSHSIDDAPLCFALGNDGGNGDCERDSANRSLDRSNSSFDIRRRWVTNFLYNLPFGKGQAIGSDWNPIVNQIFGGWQLGGIFTYQSGFYFTPGSFFDPANSPQAYGSPHASVVGNPYDFSYGQDAQAANGCPVGHQSVNCWFNPAAFTLAAPGTYGNAGRNSLLGPNLIEIDASLFKVFPVTDTKSFQFRAEFF